MSNLTDQEAPIASQVGKKLVDMVNDIESSTDINIKLSSSYRFKVDVESRRAEWVGSSAPIHHTWSMINSAPANGVPIDPVQRYPLDQSGRISIGLPIGVTIVIGKAGSGKTRFAFDHLFMATAARDPLSVKFIKFFEPSDSRVVHKSVAPAYVEPDFEHLLATEIVESLLSDSTDLTIVDSLRYLFYSSTSGATGKGGVNMALFMDLTLLDLLFARFNKRLVVLVNPLTDEDAAFSFYREAAVGSVSAVLSMESPTNASYTNRYLPDRSMSRLTFPSKAFADVYDADSSVTIRPHASSQSPEFFDRKN